MISTKGATLAVKAVFLLSFVLLFCQGMFAQAVPQAQAGRIEEVYLARDDGEGNAGEQVTEFGITDIPIYCVVLLDSNAATVVKMNFVAVRVSGVKPETKVVTAIYTTTAGQNRVNFTGRPDKRWTPGRYRVDILLDGKIARDVEFEIKNTLPNTTAVKFLQTPAAHKPKPKPTRPRRKN